MPRFLLASWLTFCALTVSTSAQTVGSAAQIAGNVVSASGQALRAVVLLQPLFRGTVRSAATSLTGAYQFSQVVPGKYLI